MFPSKLPWPIMLHMMVVLVVVMTIIFVTENPLALLGLWFMPNLPLMEEPEEQAGGDREPAIGFLAKVGQDDDDFDD